MDIYERLIQDHGKQKGLMGGIADTVGASDERRRLFRELKQELEAHANAEEQTLYAAMISEPDAQEKARHSIVEHDEMNDMIAELEDSDMSEGAWIAKFKQLRDRVVHHVDEEEDEVFARARKVISQSKAEALAAAFEKRKAAETKTAG